MVTALEVRTSSASAILAGLVPLAAMTACATSAARASVAAGFATNAKVNKNPVTYSLNLQKTVHTRIDPRYNANTLPAHKAHD